MGRLQPDERDGPFWAAGDGAGLARGVERWVVGSPRAVWAAVIVLLLGVVLGTVLIAMSRRALVAPGMVADRTLISRVALVVTDAQATQAERAAARARAPKVFVGDAAYLGELARSIRNLPVALADATSLAQVDAQVRQAFGLTEASLAQVRSQSPEAWARRADKLAELLRASPLVDSETYQQHTVSGSDTIELVLEGQGTLAMRAAELVSVDSRRLDGQLRMLVVSAGFAGEELEVVVNRLLGSRRPTYRFDREATVRSAELVAGAVQARTTRFAAGEVLFAKGDVISGQQAELARAEARAYWYGQGVQDAPGEGQAEGTSGPGWARAWARNWSQTGAWALLGLLTALGLGAYVSVFAPVVVSRPRRLASLAVLFGGAVGLACAGALIEARATVAAACVPAALVAAVLVIAYERRTALAVGSLAGLCSALALRVPIEGALLPLAGVGLVVWQLREVRHRGTLIKAGFVAGVLLAGVVLLAGLLRLPLTEAGLVQMLVEGALAGVGVLLACFVVLGLLPSIERGFGVLTPLSLIELRDPARPLLRQLQQRAPGTWAHSMNVASLAEQACQAIGADSLLAYAGALYHDVGKMNRPEMFVENQAGVNRHDKLNPAMSLLLIVAHVADGLELAREHDVPRPLWPFIESHHGTTVVEYFYHRARKQHEEAQRAGGAGAPAGTGAGVARAPDEREYRYPGPKPATKEVAVLMVCDAAEGAARAMPEPSAHKIEQMVRTIAEKRLSDGQFDQCELTMRELHTIVVTVARALASIHHGRVAYPDGGAAVVGGATLTPAGTAAPGPRPRT